MAHLPSYSVNYLPYGRHLNLTKNDFETVQNVLEKWMQNGNLEKISLLHDTNKCEHLHSRVFTLAPKNTLWTRNFTGLCHSAVHSSTFGSGKSSLTLAKYIGLKYQRSAPITKFMLNLDRLSAKNSQRKTTALYKYHKFFSRKRQCDRKILCQSFYEDTNSNTNSEHNYGINVNK